MTALTAHRVAAAGVPRVTFLDRALLSAASALDGIVAARVSRRHRPERRSIMAARDAAAAARRHAEALASVGIMPR
ncbi:hypothetical protein K0817_009420 [Microbacterium sp. HD4P20]|uniref:hypothetical protein n=1 Tax=Microbacterium sp. HD4P20 TaxID=2864874 RepID=UPI001C63BEBA|nr:hypothetical protein [Microbacterium sp. HD4P20]MCP2636781.1 hypothetical protein [Microbacterium sp. HD4P20]